MLTWPAGSAFGLWRGSSRTALLTSGSLDAAQPWASVTKAAVAYGVARSVQNTEIDLDAPLGPPGSTMKHLLAHASGLGLEASDITAPVGTRRIYSNIGVDIAINSLLNSQELATWFKSNVNTPLQLSIEIAGRASSGAIGSTNDLARLGRAWLSGGELSNAVRTEFTSCFLPDLSGVVPGFGRFTPCAWGLGLEIHGEKAHWMGSRFSANSFGHFGQSGSLLLIDPDHDVVVAALAGAPFGEWAKQLWPRWMDWLFEEYVA